MLDSEILRKARSLIDTPEKWCKGTFRRTVYGSKMLSRCSIASLIDAKSDVPASCYITLACGMGAETHERDDAIGVVTNFNDNETTDHATLMAAFGRAIDLAEAHETSQSHSPQASEVKV